MARRKTRTVVRYKARAPRRGSAALKRAQGQLISLRSRLRKTRAESTGVQAVGRDWQTAVKLAVGVNVGGAAAGAAQALYPTTIGMDTRLVAGAAVIAAGAMFLKGDAAAFAVCAGSGMLAGWTQDNVQAMLTDDGTGG